MPCPPGLVHISTGYGLNVPLTGEEAFQQVGAFFGQYAAADLWPMRHPGIAQHVPQRPHGPRLGLPRPEHDLLDSRQPDRAGAHRARLDGDRQRASAQPPAVAELAGGGAQMRDLIVRQKLCGLAKEILAWKKMARRPEVELGLIMNRMRRFEEIEDLWLQLPKEMQPEFEILMGQVEMDLMVRMERFLVKTMGVEEARRAMGLKKGEKSLTQKRQEARRIRASQIRKPKDRK